MSAGLHLKPDHPVALELESLRHSVATFQHEAHEASVKLQKYALDSSHSFERIRELESENSRLKEELAVLRANPDISPHPDSLQTQELDLTNRRLIDQLVITEATLELRTNELTNARSELLKVKQDAEGAFDLASRIRAREEEGKLRERQLEHKVRVAEEERRMADLVVFEYADLVRSLEGRRSILPPRVPPKPHEPQENGDQTKSTSVTASPALVDSFTEGKKGLKKLLAEFSIESERLEGKITKLEGDLAVAETKVEAERKTAELDRVLLAQVQAELVKLRIDDKAAARIVSRYMEFSQHSTLSLQKAIDNLKIRHAATVSTFSLEIDHLRISLATDRRQTKKLKTALDDLSEEIARETYGRRREVSLRLALLLREATVAEGLQKWSRKARELFYHSATGKEDTQASLETCVEGAEALLQILNGDSSLKMDDHGSVARIMAAQNAVATFMEELHEETGKRMELERQRGHGFFSVAPTHTSATTNRSPANVDAPPSHSTAGAAKPPSLADTSTRLIEATDVSSSSGGATEASVSAAAPSEPSPTTVVDGIPKVVAPTGAAHAPSPRLLDKTPAIDGTRLGHESDSLATLVHVEPAAGEHENVEDLKTNVVFASADAVRRPAHQEMNFAHDELPPGTVPYSNTSLAVASASASPITLPGPNKSKDSNAITHGIALPISLEIATPASSTTHPLISDLDQVRHRYDGLQWAFRDCHLTLEGLKNNISSISPVTEAVTILQTAIQRLDDFNEDARVELEIRITDEELNTRGYQTLLNVSGAVSNDADQVEVENRIRAFVDGSEKNVAKIIEQLQRKLDDLQHDVASVKKALHDLPDLELQQPSTPQATGSWPSWTNILGPPTRAASPVPPTFGTVMTSSRLRQSSSFTQSQDSRSSSVESSPTHSDPFASLGLRISMPSHAMSSPGYLGVGQSPFPSRSGSRPGTSSAMYMLGLGSRSSSLAINSAQSTNSTLSKSPISMRSSDRPEATASSGETETETEDELQTDVE